LLVKLKKLGVEITGSIMNFESRLQSFLRTVIFSVGICEKECSFTVLVSIIVAGSGVAAVAKGLVILLLYLSKRVCHDLLIFCKVREELSVLEYLILNFCEIYF